VAAEQYYAPVGLHVGDPLSLPDNFEELLAAYFSLLSSQRDRFMRASHWYQFARRAWNFSSSAAFTALVSAVEALMPETKADRHCDACNRPLGAGPTKQFIDFVDRHVPGGGETATRRRQLYSLRSALSHGGKLLHADRFTWGGMTSSSLSEWDDQRALWRLVRLILTNWLIGL
jgi:hypothetical protein